MNETSTHMNQSKVKGDILAELFKHNKSLNDAQKKLLSSFRAVFQESLNKKEGSKTVLQSIIQKKAETDGAKMTAKELVPKKDNGDAADCRGESAIFFNETTDNVVNDTTVAVQKKGSSIRLNTNGLAKSRTIAAVPEGEDIPKTADLNDILKVNFLNNALSQVVSGSDRKNAATNTIALEKSTTEIALIKAAGAEVAGKVSPSLIQMEEKQINLLAVKMVMVISKGNTDSSSEMEKQQAPLKGVTSERETEGNDKTENASLLQATNVEKNVVTGVSVVHMLISAKADLNFDVAKEAAGHIAALCADFTEVAHEKANTGHEKSTVIIDAEKEMSFKTKIAEVLTGTGFDTETADRIADQIKKVAITKEKNFQEAPVIHGNKMQPDEIIPSEKLSSQLAGVMKAVAKNVNTDQSEQQMSAYKNQEAVTDRKTAVVDKVGKNDHRREDVSISMASHANATRGKESPVAESAATNAVKEESVRRENGLTKQKVLHNDQSQLQEQFPEARASSFVVSDGGSSTPVQSVKAEAIISQIAEMRNMQTDPVGRVQMILEPPNLGKIEMDIVVRGDRVSAVMSAESSQVRQILESRAEEIKQALGSQGFRIDRIEVKQPQEKNADQWQNQDRQWNQQQGDGNQQRRERNHRWQFVMPESIPEFNMVA